MIEGRAEVRQIFKVGKSTVIAGVLLAATMAGSCACRCSRLAWRQGDRDGPDRSSSWFKDDVREVQQNFECGIGLANFHDGSEGDIIEAFTTSTVSRVVSA